MLPKALQKYLSDLSGIRNIARLAAAYGIPDHALKELLGKTCEPKAICEERSDDLPRLDTKYSNIGGDTFQILLREIPPDIAEALAKHDRVTARLGAIYMSEGTLKYEKKASRVLGCSQAQMVFLSFTIDDGMKVCTVPYACNSRCCPVCSRLKSEKTYERAYDVLQNLFERRRIDVRWITLTIRNPAAGSLDQGVKDLLKGFRRLRRPAEMNGKRGDHWNCWTENVDGYIFNLEITYNSKKRTWHPHIHIFCGGDYIAWRELKAEWTKALRPTGRKGDVKIGEAYVIDNSGKKHSLCEGGIPKELLGFLKEICKYTFAAFESDIPADRILELTETVFNKRLCGSGGDWKLPPAQERDVAATWRMEGGLQKIIETDPEFWLDKEFQTGITKACASSQSKWLRTIRQYPIYFALQCAETSKSGQK